MRRYRRTEPEVEPWIEQLVQNYGTGHREVSLRAHVVGVSTLTESQRTDEPDACMLFLSDGLVYIPAVLSTAAWERMQELEERETFSGLDNTTVSVRKFQLNFHMDAQLTSCQFYLSVSEVITVGRVTRHYHPPSCTTLHSVKQQILQTWRSLRKQCSFSSQTGLPLSCLMGAWHSDIIVDLLNDAINGITSPIVCHSGVATPTTWHRERLRCKGEEYFSTPVSHLLIPEEQRELLTADPDESGGSETPSGLLPAHADAMTYQPITVQEHERHSSTVAFDRPTDGDRSSLDHMRPEGCCGGGGAGGDRANPWDMFSPAPAVFSTPSSSSETSLSLVNDRTTTDTHLENEVQHVLRPPPCTPHVSPPTKTGQVHSDGSSFSYSYEPSPDVISALSQFTVPEHLVQWAVSLLQAPGRVHVDCSSRAENTEAASLTHTAED
ncbi:adrenocortical dysplasia protein homolog [Brachyhypopomus gauderio]|uniref:adrenocortical dysplasia protein homolog n=1 Tax=Brachyhypopomus gauderio TaxID=698409 RepID=UPI0040428F36